MRGYVFMLEAFLAGVMLIGFMLYLTHAAANSGQAFEADFSHVLPGLDRSDSLRVHAYSGDAQAIEDEITLYGYHDHVQLCDSSGACTGDRPSQGNVWLSTYFLAGDDYFEPMEVRLYVTQA